MSQSKKRHDGGNAAKDAGDDFEDWVRRHHGEALRLGILGRVDHNEPHGRIIHGQWVMVRPGVADFTGFLLDGHATTYASEAKSRVGRLQRSEIEVTQAVYLDEVSRAGGLAFLLVRLREQGFSFAEFSCEYAAPWKDVPWRVRRTAESVDAMDLNPWRVPPDRACFLEPYCPVRGTPTAGVAGGQKKRYPRE